jgi:hypothetical protein
MYARQLRSDFVSVSSSRSDSWVSATSFFLEDVANDVGRVAVGAGRHLRHHVIVALEQTDQAEDDPGRDGDPARDFLRQRRCLRRGVGRRRRFVGLGHNVWRNANAD